MPDLVDELISLDDARLTHPATDAQIDEIALRIKSTIPTSLRRLWKKSAGISFQSFDGELLGPSQVKDFLDNDQGFAFAKRGLLPFFHDNQSNYLAVYLRGARAFRVVHIPHDDGSRLVYRDMDSCLRYLIRAIRDLSAPYEPDGGDGYFADTFLRDTVGDYPPEGERTVEDVDTARQLLVLPHVLDEWNHAVQLLNADNRDEWRHLLETDHFVRREVRARMEEMSDARIKQLLRDDSLAFEQFAQQVEAAARRAGLPIGQRHRDCLQVGEHWMNLDAFFHRRSIHNAMSRLLLWFEDVAAGRDPRNRMGHFHAD